MKDSEQRAAAKAFAARWKDRGYEKGESQPFWIDLLEHVLGVENGTEFISFEDQVHLDHTSFIDGYIPSTKVLIEQKGLGKDMKKAIKQSDGTLLSPFQQAKRYITELPVSQHPRWVVTCNFSTFFVYDMEQPGGEPEVIELKDLEKEYYRLSFLVDTGNDHLKKEMEISIKAGEIVGLIYDALLEQYIDKESEETLKSLNILCVRIVFLLYCDDAGVLGKRNMFEDYMSAFDTRGFRKALIELFEVLNTKIEDRDPYLDAELKKFPYVNGGLFANEKIEIPQFTDKIRNLVLNQAGSDFDWSEISPTIFGAVFESTLNPETRRSGGMHYTSLENIHKVIDPLFLDDLKKEFEEIKDIQVERTRKKKLEEFQVKLGSLTFLDPSAGSGNFLTESYLSLRKIENEIIRILTGGQMSFDVGGSSPIKVSIGQFSGIEINDFACTVARTALWIAECQMMKQTESIVHAYLDFFPLKTSANIVEGNALRMDWNDVVDKHSLNYIMGNPPFVGFTFMDDKQKEDMLYIFPGVKNLDFVCGWYKKASDYIQGTTIEVGFVSTNSITQGETVGRLWERLNVKINFAYRTFVWNSEASDKAHVHCVIIGFSVFDRASKWIYTNDRPVLAKNINAYLIDAPDLIVLSRNKPICNVPKMVYGNKPADGGNLIIEDEDYSDFVSKDPKAVKFIKPLLGAVEYLHGKKRWCLWLEGASPAELKECPLVMDRVRKCKESREGSKAAGIRKFADTPTLFAQRTQPIGKPYIIIPRVSSEKRRYIPMGFMDGNTIVTDLVQIVPDADLYDFGILTSNVHMAWMRTVCGRLKSDYRYIKDVVYNNFPWPEVDDKQKLEIEKTAQMILDARAKYPDSTPADLYDDVIMPPELRNAHTENDRAVLKAYGISSKDAAYSSESACIAFLMERYQELAKEA